MSLGCLWSQELLGTSTGPERSVGDILLQRLSPGLHCFPWMEASAASLLSLSPPPLPRHPFTVLPGQGTLEIE